MIKAKAVVDSYVSHVTDMQHSRLVLQVDMVLKLWRNGFSINDGDIRDYRDPSNQQFLDAIKKG